MKYKNYIFDLYATLVDIHTNQNPAVFWRRIAAIMHSYGAVYKPSDLKKRYRSLIAANEARLSKELGTEYPEIELGDVFIELLLSAPEYHTLGIWGDPHMWSEEVLERWCSAFANAFRVISRIRFRLYPDTIRVLDKLKEEGKHIYLLSNAQSLFTRPEMEELGLTRYFEDIYISSEHHMKKPEPRFMRDLLEKHGLNPDESVMVGNEIRSDIVMAARCGVNGILVNHDGYSEREIEDGFAKALETVPDDRRGKVELRAHDNLMCAIM